MHPRLIARDRPDAAALIECATGRVVSYGALEKRANRLAHELRAQGIRAGDRVAVICDNRAEFMDVYWAAQRAGIIIVPVSTWLRAAEIDYIIRDSGARLVLVSARLRDTFGALAALDPFDRGSAPLLSIGLDPEWPDIVTLAASQPDTPVADEQIGGCMAYSSGTTGRPKGVVQERRTGSPVQPGPQEQFARFQQMDAETVYLNPAPLYHAAPLGMAAGVQSVGGTVVIAPRFDAEATLAAIERYRVTVLQAVPTMFIRLLALPQSVRDGYDLASLRRVIHAGAPCPVPVKDAMIDWLGPMIEEYYGGSEGNGLVAIGSREWRERRGSVGRPVSGEVHICDDRGREVPVGTDGIIYFAGGQSFSYHNDAEKTAASRNELYPDWSTLGNIGHLDANGYLFLTDRRDFTIISGGVNIYPQEVENLLVMHPEVTDAAVFGVPNAELGEEVKAVIRPEDWARATPQFAETLIAWCRAQLSAQKCPRSIDFRPDLPRTESGKLLKKQLRAEYWPAA